MTTHVFIVDKNTFKYHLQYMFAGTSCNLEEIDFNNNSTTKYGRSELGGVSLIADLVRIKVDDNIIFYLQQHNNIDGQFYGIFKCKENPFLDLKGEYLYNELGKKLFCRILLKPFEVYKKGITEWEALDEIKYINSPYQMLWSLIYRKLKGNRGNTMITIYEEDRLLNLIRNNNIRLDNTNFSFDDKKNEIININDNFIYNGKQVSINILPRLFEKYKKHQAFEGHLQTYILQNINQNTELNKLLTEGNRVSWLGNEVSCGVGMQRIDIVIETIDNYNKRLICPIELKATEYPEYILKQVQRYMDWLLQYYKPNRDCFIQPIIICRETRNKTFINDFIKFNINNRNNFCYNIKYIEFNINNQNINFNLIDY